MSETARKAEGPEAGAPRQDVSGAGAKAPEAPQASVPAEAPAPQGSQGQAGAKIVDAEPEGEAVARIQPAKQQVALTPEMLQQLAKAGVNVNSKDASGKTALMLAAGAQDARMIRELLLRIRDTYDKRDLNRFEMINSMLMKQEMRKDRELLEDLDVYINMVHLYEENLTLL